MTVSPECVPEKSYRHAPVTERAISVEADLGEEQFQRGFPRWQEICAKELPVHTSFAERRVTVPARSEDPLVQRISVRHRFWDADPERSGADWCVQVMPKRLIVNLRRRGLSDLRGYSDLREFFSRWYPRWLDCFETPEPRQVQLEYWNKINKTTVPGSANDEYVEVRDIFTSFAGTPMPPHAEKYVVPYHHEAHWQANLDGRPYRLSADIRTFPAKPLTLQAHFAATFGASAGSALDPMRQLDALHVLLLGVFDSFFTDKAREAFA